MALKRLIRFLLRRGNYSVVAVNGQSRCIVRHLRLQDAHETALELCLTWDRAMIKDGADRTIWSSERIATV